MVSRSFTELFLPGNGNLVFSLYSQGVPYSSPVVNMRCFCSSRHSSVWGTDGTWGSTARVHQRLFPHWVGKAQGLAQWATPLFRTHLPPSALTAEDLEVWKHSSCFHEPGLVTVYWEALTVLFQLLEEFLGSSRTPAQCLMFREEWIMVFYTDVPLYPEM